MTNNMVERLRAERDSAEADYRRLQEALAAAEAERDEAHNETRRLINGLRGKGVSQMLSEAFDAQRDAEAKLASLPALLAETRKKALEEAAQVAEMRHWTWKQNIAAAIRSLSNEEAPK